MEKKSFKEMLSAAQKLELEALPNAKARRLYIKKAYKEYMEKKKAEESIMSVLQQKDPSKLTFNERNILNMYNKKMRRLNGVKS